MSELRTAAETDYADTNLIPVTKVAGGSGLFKATIAGLRTAILAGASLLPSLTGNAGKALFVKSDESGVEWDTVTGGGGGGSVTVTRWTIPANGTGASQNIVDARLTGLTINDVIVVVGGIVQLTTDFTIAGDVLTITTNVAGDKIEIHGFTVTGSGGGGGGGGRADPTLVQHAYGRGTGLVNVNFPAAPTIGNLLVIVNAGVSNSRSYPVGFNIVYSTVPTSSQQFQIATKICDAFDTETLFANGSDYSNIVILEVAGFGSVQGESGALESIGSTYTTWAFPVYQPYFGKGILVAISEHDATGDIVFDANTDILESHNFSDGGNHHAASVILTPGHIGRITGSSSGLSSPMYGICHIGGIAS